MAQQAVAEVFAEMYGAPSRSEIDDVHRSLTDLRREVRALKRAERTRRTAENRTTENGTAGDGKADTRASAKPVRGGDAATTTEGTAE